MEICDTLDYTFPAVIDPNNNPITLSASDYYTKVLPSYVIFTNSTKLTLRFSPTSNSLVGIQRLEVYATDSGS